MSADLVVRCRAEIDRLRKVAEAQTFAPWTVSGLGWVIDADGVYVAEETSLNDASLIVAAVNLFPAALDAFTAILDEHEAAEERGAESLARLARRKLHVWSQLSEAEALHMAVRVTSGRAVAAVAAALGVGDQETQP